MTNKLQPVISVLIVFCAACSPKKQGKSDLEIVFTQDTLAIGYTYWWPESGPFIGECGEELSLVFSGTVSDIMDPTDEAGPLYTSQKGIIQINRVFKTKDLGPKSYDNQQFVVMDCFYGSGLQKEDKVLVFCYDYENALSIPGNTSILKIDSLDDPLIKSTKKYIDAGENPSKIKKDLKLWKKYGLDDNLKRIMECNTATKRQIQPNIN